VIALFNGSIPLVAIQMQALKVGEHLTLSFTTVVDELTRGLVDEDEDAKAAPADRAYWESKATRDTVGLADELLVLAHRADPTLEMNYTKFYIGMTRQSQPFNVLAYRPRKNHLVLSVRLPESEELTARIEGIGLETQPYDRRDGSYRLRLNRRDVNQHKEGLAELMALAVEQRAG
jgi:hypothetical protein